MRIPGQQLFADLTEQAETPIVVSCRLGHSDGAASAAPPTPLFQDEDGDCASADRR